MARRVFNGLEIDVPDGWADKSTLMLTRTTINLVGEAAACARERSRRIAL